MTRETTEITGTWELRIHTPIGVQEVVLMLEREGDTLRGTATRGEDQVVLEDVAQEGARVRWQQQVTRPMKLTLRFEVVIEGDVMRGVARAGVLPSSRVSGERRHAS